MLSSKIQSSLWQEVNLKFIFTEFSKYNDICKQFSHYGLLGAYLFINNDLRADILKFYFLFKSKKGVKMQK